MGNSSYSTTDRAIRSHSAGFATKSRDEVFTQQKHREPHPEMRSQGIVVRECRDSVEHPNTVPIQLYMDVTASMGAVPHELIKEGLPTLIGKLIQEGVADVALMFGAIGDHECDRFPLQVAQFESGDEELDMWLTRTYLEGGGGGNAGESYSLAHYFATHHVETDAFSKREKKGFVFTIGDEPNLQHYPQSAINELMGETSRALGMYSAQQLYESACEQNHVFHIHVNRRPLHHGWTEIMGQNVLVVDDHRDIPNLIASTVLSYQEKKTFGSAVGMPSMAEDVPVEVATTPTTPEEIL